MNHHPEHSKYQTATAEEYEAFYGRVEDAFDVEDMTQERLSKWLNNDSLADTFAFTRDVYMRARDSESIQELRDLQAEARGLLVHRDTVNNFIEEKIRDITIKLEEERIARTITLTEKFAKSRRIKLNERTKGGIYENWGRYHKPAIVIFKKGKLKAWRYI